MSKKKIATKKKLKKDNFKLSVEGNCNTDNICNNKGSGCGSVIYGLGFIGALVYYISTAPSFWMGVWGVIKAIVWPAFLVYEILKFMGI